MPLSEFKQGSVLCQQGEHLKHISFITNGSVEASFSGHPFRLGKGDVIGVCDLSAGIHSHTYTAASDVTILTYACESFDALESLLRDNADVAFRLINSMCRQIAGVLQYRAALKHEADGAYETIEELYPEYERLCALYALTPKKLPGVSEIKRFSESDPISDWMHNYYSEIKGLDPTTYKGFFYCKLGISSGFLRKSAEDILNVYQSCGGYQNNLRELSEILLNSEGHDLFSLVADLHISSINIKGADAIVEALVSRLTVLLFGMTDIDPDIFKNRLTAYQEQLESRRSEQVLTDAPAEGEAKQNLSDSLDVILEYSECPEEMCNKFKHLVRNFTMVSDRSDSSDVVRGLRRELTDLFYQIYQPVFIKTLEDPAPPTIIKMFLNFGYVDAALAGHENADYLYSIADSLKGDPDNGIYLLRDWLTAVYEGKVEPCRNEYDMDYPEHLHSLKKERKIDDKEEAALLKDNMAKLRFEMDNVFPVANKITFGRITTFCPVFSDHVVQRKLEASFVNPELLKKTFDDIRSIDFSAYYREILYTNPELEINNETTHIEVLPNIIIMPNIGVRGAMWQDIEGRKRSTPARMFISIFLETDLKALAIKLTGEFRWEMCKRVQGLRWNDITEPSLTSEYSDYLQFYKNNKELSPEARELVKSMMSRANKNYKTAFVMEYSKWLLNESNGSPHLNRIVLKFMLTYCPFSADIRENLMKNPRYTELLTRNGIKRQQRVKYIQRVIQRVTQMGKKAPQEILDELEFAQR
ncbi:MAG: cyclic nucleotide-binding domain-containing protein [Oscillospiraceae bacterium]|nr:cyclic nucleotide-binding domain-containing protein [Oscillospiraceae bacterium]